MEPTPIEEETSRGKADEVSSIQSYSEGCESQDSKRKHQLIEQLKALRVRIMREF